MATRTSVPPSTIPHTSSARSASAALPRPVSIALAILTIDLGNYVAHWAMHRFDVLWEFHKVHHSSPALDWLATFREHPVEEWWRRLCGAVPIVALGVPLDAAVVGVGVVAAWGILNHANLRPGLRFLESVTITPELHRLHHVPRTSERNLGIVFSWWDRLRGTLVRAEAPPDVVLGVPGEPAYPQTWSTHQVVPFRRLAARVRRQPVHLVARP